MFSIENPVFSFLGKLVDLVVLNLLFIVCSIPIFTIGASWTALYYVSVKMVKNEESYIWRDFFKSFKQNFKQATIIWILNLFAILVLVVDIYVLLRNQIEEYSTVMIVSVVIMGIILIAVMLYVYPVLSHFDNSIKNTIRNAFILSLGNLPYTVLFLLISLLPVIAFISPVGVYISPLILLMGVSGPTFLCSFGWKRIFTKLEPERIDKIDDGKEED